MNDDLLIIRTNMFLSREDLQKFREFIVRQREQSGNVIVLPYGCDVIRSPNDVEIKVQDISESERR
jgi:hypothetical protein